MACFPFHRLLIFFMFGLTQTISIKTNVTSLPFLQHPRLLLNSSQLQTLVNNLNTTQGQIALSRLSRAGEEVLTEPLVQAPNCTVAGACRGPWFSGNYIDSKTASNAIITCALLYRITQNNTWSEYVLRAMKHALELPSWYWPVGQALQFSELSYSVAIGYDWLYDTLSELDRHQINEALISRTLRKSQQNFDQGLWWTQDIYNWNLVSHAGPISAALAVDSPNTTVTAMAQDVLRRSLEGMGHALPSFGPDGVWPEGLGYQTFALQHAFLTARFLQSAYGHDFGILSSPGLENTAQVFLYMTGPSYLIFNWGDSHLSSPAIGNIYACAHLYDNQLAGSVAQHWLQSNPYAVIDWWALVNFVTIGNPRYLSAQPLGIAYSDPSTDNAYGNKTHLASLRACWLCENASWVAIKGGNNLFDDHGSNSHNDHGHMDLGQFVIEMHGQRWAVDAGSGAYDFPLISYFGRFRFSYHRLNSHGHNTLSFDGAMQDQKGSAAIVAIDLEQRKITADLTGGYARGGASEVTRTVLFNDDYTQLTVTDHWQHARAQTVTWRMNTLANITRISDRQLSLRQGGQQVVFTSETGTVSYQDWDLAFPQSNQGHEDPDTERQLRQILVEVPASTTELSITLG
eukprot:TRINITY_DN8549_c0_g1_i3.p1 TRINITY_DN8549_c0_g1~~TRINITY_DN8549_c0_g1_i3.p1  ORF type:complete len:629 (+),score=80.62 TRINITY_DN8549_c0_g1_i3:141-2027(+)